LRAAGENREHPTTILRQKLRKAQSNGQHFDLAITREEFNSLLALAGLAKSPLLDHDAKGKRADFHWKS